MSYLVLKRSLGAVVLIAAVGIGGVAAFAPQVPTLAREGFPPNVWTGRGRFATVQGIPQTTETATGASVPEAAEQRFENSGGRALLAEKGGTLVYEAYSNPLGPEDRLNSFSMVKSLVGALVVRAMADGRISFSDTVGQYIGPNAPDITIGGALAMSSGLLYDGEPAKSVDDAGFSPFGPLARLHVYGTDAILADLSVDPGAKGMFAYQSVNTALLGSVLEAAYDQPLPLLLSEQIWKPAGAADAEWRVFSKANGVSAYCCLFARPKDWLRVGRYLLNNGTSDAPFLPDDLWRDFLRPDLAPEQRRKGAYGWHLRHDVLDREGEALSGPFAYFMGHGGQMVYLLPDSDMVVVRFGEAPQLLHSTLYELAPMP